MRKILFVLSAVLLAISAEAKEYSLSTPNSTLIISATEGEVPYFLYYGSRVEVGDVKASGRALSKQEAYPAYGTYCHKPFASLIKQFDGDNAVKLIVKKVTESTNGNLTTLSILLRDVAHPTLAVKLNYSAYSDLDIVKMNTEYINEGKKPVVLQKYMSAVLPIQSDNCVLLHLAGSAQNECNEIVEPLNDGIRVISAQSVSHISQCSNASFMLGLEGHINERDCPVIAGTLVWMGNYYFEFNNSLLNSASTLFMGGINPAASDYTLAGNKSFATPEMVFTYTTNGKGEASRTLHRWARKYQLLDGTKEREVLLNSWEGVRFDTTEANLEPMITDFAALGGEMFVIDDGWFGAKYPRDNDKSSLGDWGVATSKLPNGIRPLIDLTHKHGMKFGIWIEPEMVNIKSELYEKHPDWVLRHPDFEPTAGRGGGQLILDLTNPKVQNFVFEVVDKLLTENPDIEYIKWDNNMSMRNTQSLYLPKELQSNLQVDYILGLEKVLKQIRAKYPNVIIQLCAGGGARLNYGFMPYFQEMWTSDQTDAYHRILIQWGAMNFYPSNMLAAHVSSAINKHTQRLIPIKFRFDVASMCRLGMEMVPAHLNSAERDYAKRAIAEYKTIRPVVQQGDLYRLISPYESSRNFASLMYVNEVKDRAVLFAYRFHFRRDMSNVILRLQGLKENAKYRIREVTPEYEDKPVAINGNVISGRMLMNEGIMLPELIGKHEFNLQDNGVRTINDYRSIVLELIEVK